MGVTNVAVAMMQIIPALTASAKLDVCGDIDRCLSGVFILNPE
jgi:hypothetical protein